MRKLKKIWELLVLRDLRGKWVLPRLVFVVSVHAAERTTGKVLAVFVLRPVRRISEFKRTLREHQESSEIAFAGIAVLNAFFQASVGLLLAIVAAIVVGSHL